MDRILIPVDGSEPSQRAAAFGARLARDAGATVTLLFAYDWPTASGLGLRSLTEQQMERAKREISKGSFDSARKAMADYDVPVETEVAVGDPPSEIIAWTDKNRPDLVVMGSRGHTQLQGLMLGSVSERVLRGAHCPVTVVR
jgi:nucleotide-binding universal stress UspA family protein